jgi:hypothetical protein
MGPSSVPLASAVGLPALLVTLVGTACSDAEAPVGSTASPIVYGADDRVEYYQEPSLDARSLLAAALVVLVPRSWILVDENSVKITAPSWRELDGLCPGEPFGEQPAAAFCTGVLVDWDLILTAGHCVRALGLSDFTVVAGYYYTAPGELSVTSADLRQPIEVVSEATDSDGVEPRLDFAWLRLDRPFAPPRRPAAVYVEPPAYPVGTPILFIGAAGGAPIKVDAGGSLRDARASVADYFSADTDSYEGASGGGAFDDTFSLLGVLARGGEDFSLTEAGCYVSARSPDGSVAAEQFTYAHRAVERLCSEAPSASSICRPGCGTPCRALAPAAAVPLDTGCSLAFTPTRSRGGELWLAAAVLCLRRVTHRCGRRRQTRRS